MIDVEAYWEKCKGSPWDCGGGLIWPIDFLADGWYFNRKEGPVPPKRYREDAAEHAATIEHWVETFRPYVGKEDEIPSTYAATLSEDGELEDGFHRLVAAKKLGIKYLPSRLESDTD